ncbi:PREDICTED: poly [ADP-ribose] polymerase 9 [Elephantulus edwardii]|uniref:poly [ADP-ribose] polymerase 9 n=1 Tax=Elephantulus edwardii TaxID=28737 RepID=UPI0003F0BD72|nr:PREDICTED: poly [ADP-ribose] polymerase 9 [Elephantulus edwardii]
MPSQSNARVVQYRPFPTKGNTEETDPVNESCRWETQINHNDFKIFKSHEKQLCEVFRKKFGCFLTIVSPLQGSDTSSQPVFKKMLTPGVELSVWKDDLTTHAVDAVVNAANEVLQHGGGLARALVSAGGYEIQEESTSLVTIYGRVPTGEIAVTGAGRLPCKLIIHAVGPQWTKRDEGQCIEQLKRAIRNILDYVYKYQNIKSLAIPAISSGIFQFPLDLCTCIIVETIVVYLQNRQMTNSLKEIHLVSNEDPTVNAFTTASEAILGRNNPESWVSQETPSAAMADHKPALTSLSNYSVPDSQGREEKIDNGFYSKFPVIIVKGNKEAVQEAEAWVRRLLTLQGHHIIENNHILYLGKKEHDILSQLQKTSNVSISEIIDSEKAKLKITGAQTDLLEAVIIIEHLLCHVQEEMAMKMEQDLLKLLGRWAEHQPKFLEEMKFGPYMKCRKGFSSPALRDRKKEFEKCGLQVIKVEEIKNDFLSTVFQVKKKMMEASAQREPVSHRLFQQVPQQFCQEVYRVGFQRMYSEPCDPKYGAGIYFTKNLKNLVDRIKKTASTDTLIYIFEAEVLTGSFCQGCQLNVVPPALSPGAIDSHDSVVDNVSSPETFVIFSGTQAMPVYLWTCTQNTVATELLIRTDDTHYPHGHQGRDHPQQTVLLTNPHSM